MTESNETKLTRDVAAVQIPSGEKTTLEARTDVTITQSLGGSFTVVVAKRAGLFRISAKDADALGREVVSQSTSATEGAAVVDEDQVWEALKSCYDPEIPVNIVDLGLIYGLDLQTLPEGGQHVEAKMTLTAQGCGMGPAIAADAEEKILALPGIKSANVAVVWDPPWSPDRITPEGREKLGMV